jgi:hypothetical protein
MMDFDNVNTKKRNWQSADINSRGDPGDSEQPNKAVKKTLLAASPRHVLEVLSPPFPREAFGC